MSEHAHPSNDQALNDHSEREADRLTGWVQIVLVLGVLLAAIVLNRLLMNGGDDQPNNGQAAQLAPVEVMLPEIVAARIQVEATGVVQARTRVSLTPEVGGRVIEMVPELAAGGRFAAGQVLFVIDPTDAELSIARAEADLSSAESALALEQAEADIAEREWRLVNGDEPIPPLVARQPQLAQARAAIESARSRLGDARVALQRTQFSMPFEGRVISSEVELGQTVNPNMAYGAVYPIDAVEVVLSISPAEAARLAPLQGRTVWINPLSGTRGGPIAGRVTRVAAELDERTRLVDVVVQTDQVDSLLPGTFINAAIEGGRVDQAIWLPVETVSRNDRVWIVDNGTLQSIEITPLMRRSDRLLARAFPFAEGVVVTLPPDAAPGLAVQALSAGSTQVRSHGVASDG